MIGMDWGVMVHGAWRAIASLHHSEGDPAMNAFPLLAAFTICVSIAVLSASFDDLREAPFTHDRGAGRELFPPQPTPAGAAWTPSTLGEANEGLLDRELASADPVQAWLERYLTPPAN
jgi:hypothetical protein